jgi:hypothetical protein
MQIEEILNYAFPYTDEDLLSSELMVDRYKHGDIVNFDVLNISVDMEEILKRINN